jgi:hypothetical protein
MKKPTTKPTSKPVSRAKALVILSLWKTTIEAAVAVRGQASEEDSLELDSELAAFTESVAETLGDTTCALGWFWKLNDMGSGGCWAAPITSPGGGLVHSREIKTLADLLWLIGYEDEVQE